MRPSGGQRWRSFRIVGVYSIVEAPGEQTALRNVRNITAQKRAEEALRSLNLDLQHCRIRGIYDLQSHCAW